MPLKKKMSDALNKFLDMISPGKSWYWPEKNENIKRFSELTQGKTAINIGARNDAYDEHVINVNIFISEHTDIVADVHALPFKSSSTDGVCLTALLEHVKYPWVAAEEIQRVLKPGGLIYMEHPWIYNHHPDPIDCWRFSHEAYPYLFPQIQFSEIKIAQGPSATVTNIMQNYIASFFGHYLLFRIAWIVTGWIVYPVKFLDIFLRRKKYAHLIANGFYCWGKKRL